MVRDRFFAIISILIVLTTFSMGCMESGDVIEVTPTVTVEPTVTLTHAATITATAMVPETETSTPTPTATIPAEEVWMTVTDDLGREVTLSEKPERIVSLAPSTTEILFAIGAGDRVVGVDEISNYPPEVEAIDKVGKFSTINTEMVMSLDPDLVVAAYGNGIETIDVLSDLGIPVVGLNPTTLNETLRSINRVGALTGCEENATRLTENMSMKIDMVRSAAEEADYEPRVLYVIWYDPLYSAGNGTFEDEMIGICRGNNLASDLPAYGIMTLETVIDGDPEIIITTSGGGMGLDETNLSYEYITTDSRFAGLSAVKDDKIYVIDADIACRPAPRIVDALEELLRYIHPELEKNPVL